MEKIFITSFVLLLLASCQKEGPVAVVPEAASQGSEILIGLRQADELEVTTKASLISSLPSSLYWSATSGSSTETSVYASTSGTVSSGVIATGKYQKASKPTYNWYVSNGSISHTSGGSTIAVNNGTDLFAGYTSDDTASPSITLNHIFACLGAIELTAPSGYTASDISMTIKARTGGTYNIKKKTFSGSSEETSSTSLLSGSITTAGGKASATATHKMTIPGDYILAVGYTLTRGDYSESFYTEATIELVGGMINAIRATLPDGDAQEIKIRVSLTAWGDNTININNGQSGSVSWDW